MLLQCCFQKRTVLASYGDDVFVLTAAHAEIPAARPDKRPGQFKEEANRAGQTTFVAPDLVRGTLRQGIAMARGLAAPFARAAMLMFLLSEVHPFDDGNGRIARAFMNAELISGRNGDVGCYVRGTHSVEQAFQDAGGGDCRRALAVAKNAS